jgi:hypothetical protein
MLTGERRNCKMRRRMGTGEGIKRYNEDLNGNRGEEKSV